MIDSLIKYGPLAFLLAGVSYLVGFFAKSDWEFAAFLKLEDILIACVYFLPSIILVVFLRFVFDYIRKPRGDFIDPPQLIQFVRKKDGAYREWFVKVLAALTFGLIALPALYAYGLLSGFWDVSPFNISIAAMVVLGAAQEHEDYLVIRYGRERGLYILLMPYVLSIWCFSIGCWHAERAKLDSSRYSLVASFSDGSEREVRGAKKVGDHLAYFDPEIEDWMLVKSSAIQSLRSLKGSPDKPDRTDNAEQPKLNPAVN